ncbi:MAG: hypothetical protein KAI76_00725, partial [Alphaproteobacteria bacterium]|nr:hypothetical protein [Alphaproteobacteria bacterium]
IDFTIAPEYSMNLSFGGEGLPEFNSSPIDLIIGDFTPFHNSGAVTYSVSVTNAVYTVDQNTTNSAGEYLTTLASTADNAIFSVNGSGELLVNDPMALSYDANPSGFDLVITATDSVGNTTAFDQHLDMRDYMPGIDPSVYFGTSPFVGTSGADFMIGGPDTEINGNGGADVLIGRNGDNNISVSDNAFIHVDGSGGNDTLTLGTVSSTNFMLDFTTFPEWKVKNIENIDIGLSNSMSGGFYVGNHIKLDIQDVFDMTDPITHTLHITSPVNSIDGLVEIIMSSASGDFTLGSGTVGIEGTGTTQLTYTGTHISSDSTVTLVIDQITVSGDASGDITVNQV